jgi:hypothetical protein
MVSINEATKSTNNPVELCFVTDEISLPVENGKMVCDLLALRRDHGRSTPVLLERSGVLGLTCLQVRVSPINPLQEAVKYLKFIGKVQCCRTRR